MKKLLFVIDSLNSGGAEKSLTSLLNLLDYSRYQVDVMLMSREGLFLPLLPKKVNLLDPPVCMTNRKNGPMYLLKNFLFRELFAYLALSISIRLPIYAKKYHGAQLSWKWLGKIMNKHEKSYDVAIAYSQGMPTYFVADKVSAKLKLSWVNIDYKEAGYNKHFDKPFYEKFNKTITVSHLNHNIFTEVFPEFKNQTAIIYDIISSEFVNQLACSEGGFTDSYDGIKLLSIGRLTPQKGYDLAIEACRKLKSDGIPFKWYIIGEGELREQILEQIEQYGLQEHLILLGTFSNPYPFIKQCDIYVQPSKFEGYGLAIAEARILRKPIVTTNFSVVHNQIVHESNGLIVNMNAEDLYKGIRRMIVDEMLRKRVVTQLMTEQVGTEKEIYKFYSLVETAN